MEVKMEQISLFNYGDESKKILEPADKLTVVNAVFAGSKQTDCEELFDGYDELYAITFSSGITDDESKSPTVI